MGISSVTSYNAGYFHPFLKHVASRWPARLPSVLSTQAVWVLSTSALLLRRETLIRIGVCACEVQQNLSERCWAGSFPVTLHGEVKKAAQEAGKTAAMFTR